MRQEELFASLDSREQAKLRVCHCIGFFRFLEFVLDLFMVVTGIPLGFRKRSFAGDMFC